MAGNYPQNDSWLYSSFWYRDFDGMAYKTMLRQLISRWGIMSIDMVEAMDKDMTIINADGSVDYVESEEEPAAVATVEPVEVNEVPVPDQGGADQTGEPAPEGEEPEGLVFE